MRPLAYISFVAVFLLCNFSENAFSESDKPAELGQVVVEAPVENESPEKPSAFVSVIYPDKYSAQLTTLPELLSQQVGVHVQNFGGLGQLSTVSIRGSTADQVSVYLDGVKINTAQGGAVDFSTLPLGSIERVEVLRGGASSRFGSDAIGGVINIVTKKAQRKKSLELRYSQGSFLTIETHEGFSKTFDKVGLTFDHTHLSSKGDFTFLSTGVEFAGGGSIGGGQEFTRLNNQFLSEGVLTRVDGELSKTQHLSFTNDFFISPRNLPGTEIETTQLFPTNPLDAQQNLFRNATGIQWTCDNFFVKNLNFSLQPNYRIERSHFTDPTPAIGGPIENTSLNQSAVLKPKWSYEKDFNQHSHLFTFLYDFRYDRFNDSSPIPQAPLSGLHQRVTDAFFFQDEISLLNEKLYFNPSVRFENTSDFGNNAALHFGVVGKPASWVQLKSNIENSFRYPSFDELYFPDEGFIRGNPNLFPEKAINFDAGATFNYKWANLELAYFRNNIQNSIVFVPISAFTIAPLNTGPVTSQGMETSLSLQPVSFFTFTGNYTLLLAYLNETGKQLPGRPKHLANGKVEFSWKHGSIYGQVQYIDRLPIDFTNTKFIRGAALVDVGGTVKIKNHYYVTLQGKNIGNVQTLDAVGFPLPRAQVYFSFGYKS